MNWKILLSIAIVGLLSFVAFLGYVNRESNPDRLFANLIGQMQNGKLENIYEKSSNFLQINAENKEVFAERMSIALDKMKRADEKLEFQREESTEKVLTEVTRNSRESNSGRTIWTVKKLGMGENQVEVTASWNNYGGFLPKLVDLSVRKKSKKEYISALLGTLPK